MKKTPRPYWLVAIAIAIMAANCGPATSPLEGKEAPVFTAPLAGGGEFDLAKHRGEDIVVLEFWATWCGPCRRSLPAIADLAKQFEGKPVAVYAVNVGDSAASVEGFLKSREIDLPAALDSNGEVARKYDVQSIPTLLVIDREGMVRYSHMGYSDTLQRRTIEDIEALLNE